MNPRPQAQLTESDVWRAIGALIVSLILCAGPILFAAAPHPAAAQDQSGDVRTDLETLPKHALARLGVVKAAAPLAGVYGLVLSPDSKRLATRGADQVVRLWDIESGRQLAAIDAHKDRVHGLAFSPDGTVLATSSVNEDPVIRLWDGITGKPRSTLPLGARVLEFVSNDSLLAVNRRRATLIGLAKQEQNPLPLADGTPLAAAGSRNLFVVFDPTAGVAIRLHRNEGATQVLMNLSRPPMCAALALDGSVLAVCCEREDLVHIWDLKHGNTHFILSGHTAPVEAVAISPDCRHVASASWDKTVRIWELSTRRLVAALEGHRDQVCAVAFSADGRRLASGAAGSADKSALIWDLPAALYPAGQPLEKLDLDARTKVVNQLAAEEPAVAYAAVGTLRASPKLGLSLLAARLPGAGGASDEAEIRQLIKQLDDDDFARREAAHKRLIELRAQADALLREALAVPASAEVQHRLKQILEKPIDSAVAKRPEPDKRLLSRIVLTLELIGDDAARQQLAAWAKGPSSDEQAAEAAAALKRLESRQTK